jgi:hypothetical protein
MAMVEDLRYGSVAIRNKELPKVREFTDVKFVVVVS